MEKMERENGPGPSRPGLRQALNCLQGRNEGDKGGTIPWAQNHCGGRGMTARGTKKSNSVASTFLNAVHSLPKDLRFERGAPNLLLAPGAI